MRRSLLSLLLLSLPLLCAAASPIDSCALVRLTTTEGSITVALYNDTPLHRDNFLKLVRSGFYNGLLFHRVIGGFMIQSGDPDSRNAEPGAALGEGGPGYTIPHEILYPAHYHKRGALAAARESDDVNPDFRSSGSQFYIVWGKPQTDQEIARYEASMHDNSDGTFQVPEDIIQSYISPGGTPWLDGSYTVFGEVTKGLDVVKRIQGARTDRRDRPKTDIRITKAEVIREPQL